MEPFDKRKGKLREEGPLPEGFGWEDMQEGIFEKMAEIEEPKASKKQYDFWKLTFFLLGMVVTIGIGLLFHFVNFEEKETVANAVEKVGFTESKSKPNIIDENSTLSSDESLIYQEKESDTLSKIGNHPTENSIHQDFQKIDDDASEIKNIQVNSTSSGTEKEKTTKLSSGIKRSEVVSKTTSHLSNNRKREQEAISETDYKISKQTNISLNFEEGETILKSSPPTVFNNNSNPVETAGGQADTKIDRPIWRLTFLEKQPIRALDYYRLPTINFLSLSNPLVVEKGGNLSRFSMAIGIGLNYWTPNWGNSTASQERAQFEKALAGNTYAFHLDYALTPKWSIGSGIINSTYYSQFNYQAIETVQRVKENSLVEIQVNTVTGDSSRIYGNQTVNVNRQRTIVHYNTFKKWSLPLTLKYVVRNGKIEYNFGVGTLLTLNTTTEGRTLNNTIQDYNASSPIYHSGFEIGALGTIDVKYHLSTKYFVGTQLSTIGSLKNWSTQNEVELKPILFNGQLTVGMKF